MMKVFNGARVGPRMTRALGRIRDNPGGPRSAPGRIYGSSVVTRCIRNGLVQVDRDGAAWLTAKGYRALGGCRLSDIRRTCPHWFEPGAIRFFRSPGGIYFVSSESDGTRRYTVRGFDGSRITTAGDFGGHSTLRSARKTAKTLAKGAEDED